VISLINPILRGWVNYFAVGHASECFGYIQDWVAFWPVSWSSITLETGRCREHSFLAQ
jgi:hypothetical protein